MPETVDSLVVWSSTSSERPHTISYIVNYGWSWQLENGRFIRIYCFSPKGYYISGNGGMWVRGKSIVIVEKNGIVSTFNNPTKQADAKFRRQLASLVADDPVLVAMINESRGRRDKILRMLSLYSPIL